MPSGLIEGNGGSAPIVLDVLERGIQKATKKLDKRYDLTARAGRADVSNESLFTMMLVLAAALQGYTPEQLLVDGLLGGGLRLSAANVSGITIDEKGRPIKPGITEVSEDQEEAAPQIETFVLETLETIGGVDPHMVSATTPFRRDFEVEIMITASSSDGASILIDGSGFIGRPEAKKLREFVVGKGEGKLEGSGACFISGGPKHPYTLGGNVAFGIGPGEAGTLSLRIVITDERRRDRRQRGLAPTSSDPPPVH